MSVMLDLIGSVVIGTFVLLMGLQLNRSIAGSADASLANLNVQQGMAELAQSIEYDFRKIGFDMPNPGAAITLADSSHIEFKGNMDHDDAGNIETVEWYLGPALTTMPNPNVHILFRNYNGEGPVGTSGIGVTMFHLTYFNKSGDTVHYLDAGNYPTIRVIEISMTVQSPYRVQDEVNPDTTGYAASYWRQTRLSSRNLTRHGG